MKDFILLYCQFSGEFRVRHYLGAIQLDETVLVDYQKISIRRFFDVPGEHSRPNGYKLISLVAKQPTGSCNPQHAISREAKEGNVALLAGTRMVVSCFRKCGLIETGRAYAS